MRYREENIVQQGSFLIVTLFGVAIDCLVNAILPSVTTYVHVDDGAIFCASRIVLTIERWLEGAINSLG